jgi:3-hydroxyisobutyrate dehydrogenase-like beta-hydroxyacid dehydrogenase
LGWTADAVLGEQVGMLWVADAGVDWGPVASATTHQRAETWSQYPRSMHTVGLLHPGEMGASIGAALRRAGVEVLWVSAGRGPATRRRAQAADLTDVGTLPELVVRSDLVVSVCPPHAAIQVARSVAGLEFGGLYVDANAVAPTTARALSVVVERAGGRFVDGDLIGGPVRAGGATRLYLSGPAAGEVAALFAPTDLEAVALAGDVAAASALKMCYAAWTKGTSALLLAIRAAAGAYGVEEALVAEWTRTQPGLAARSQAAAGTARKAWRFAGEMDQIAACLAEAGLPDGFARAAAELYRRLAAFKDVEGDPPLDQVLERARAE